MSIQTRKLWINLIAASATCLALAPLSHADTVEVLLGQVFVPQSGYGSNNNVQLTLDGYLPNSCYQLGKASVDTQDNGHTFVVHQFAEQQTEGVCAAGAALPAHLADIVPYTYDISLGRLAAGTYEVKFDVTTNPVRSHTFTVYQSHNLSADDIPYAAISTINMGDVVNGVNPVSAELIGTLTSSCNFLSDVKVTLEDDVIVVQPILGRKQGVVCTQSLRPLSKKISLGQFGEGRYLVHVRSANGNSVSHAFTVVIPDPSTL